MIAKINPDLEVMCRPIAELKNDPDNVRRHSERNIQAIADSLMQFGQQKTIVVRGDIVIAGNGTLEAAKRLGWDRLAVTEFDGKGHAATAFALADNRTAELAEWDFPALSAQIGLFEDQLELGALWSPEELDALKTVGNASKADPVGITPEEKKAIFEANTIKQIVIYLGDDQYREVLTKFRDIAASKELQTNTEVVLHLLKHYENA